MKPARNRTYIRHCVASLYNHFVAIAALCSPSPLTFRYRAFSITADRSDRSSSRGKLIRDRSRRLPFDFPPRISLALSLLRAVQGFDLYAGCAALTVLSTTRSTKSLGGTDRSRASTREPLSKAHTARRHAPGEAMRCEARRFGEHAERVAIARARALFGDCNYVNHRCT